MVGVFSDVQYNAKTVIHNRAFYNTQILDLRFGQNPAESATSETQIKEAFTIRKYQDTNDRHLRA